MSTAPRQASIWACQPDVQTYLLNLTVLVGAGATPARPDPATGAVYTPADLTAAARAAWAAAALAAAARTAVTAATLACSACQAVTASVTAFTGPARFPRTEVRPDAVGKVSRRSVAAASTKAGRPEKKLEAGVAPSTARSALRVALSSSSSA